MIRAELFFDTVSYRLGFELQLLDLNFQTSLGWSLLWEFSHNVKKVRKSGGDKTLHSGFIGLGPLAVVAWVDP